jgi:hypothetical protein
MSRVYTYMTSIGLRALCSDCATLGDHGCGELQDYKGGEHKGICAGAKHECAPFSRRSRLFNPDNVCTSRLPNRGLAAGVAAEILAGEGT